MDPIAMATTALRVIQKAKQGVDEAKKAIKDGKTLMKEIDMFELTIGMIPRRSPKVDGVEGPANVDVAPGQVTNDSAEGKKYAIEKVKEEAKKAKEKAIEKAKDEGTKYVKENMNQLSDLADEAQGVMDDAGVSAADMVGLFKLLKEKGGGGKAIDITKRGSAQQLTDMRRNGEDELDITFAGMAIVLLHGVELIKKGLALVDQLEKPDRLWLCQPWRVNKQRAVGKKIQGFADGLHAFDDQLRGIIQIASYALQLEQLMDASAALRNPGMRRFWKNKVGISVSRTPIMELTEAFFDHNKEVVQKERENAPLVGSSPYERIGVVGHDKSEVALWRFLDKFWNTNEDSAISVYELNAALRSRGIKSNEDAVGKTLTEVMEKEEEFCSNIKFTVTNSDEDRDEDRDDGCVNNNGWVNKYPNIYNFVDYAEMYAVRPYQPIEITVRVENYPFDLERYTHDSVTILQFKKTPMQAHTKDDKVMIDLGGKYGHEWPFMTGSSPCSWNFWDARVLEVAKTDCNGMKFKCKDEEGNEDTFEGRFIYTYVPNDLSRARDLISQVQATLDTEDEFERAAKLTALAREVAPLVPLVLRKRLLDEADKGAENEESAPCRSEALLELLGFVSQLRLPCIPDDDEFSQAKNIIQQATSEVELYKGDDIQQCAAVYAAAAREVAPRVSLAFRTRLLDEAGKEVGNKQSAEAKVWALQRIFNSIEALRPPFILAGSEGQGKDPNVSWEIMVMNMSAESICLFYDAENGEPGSLMDEIGPFSNSTIETYQDHKFYVTPEHADDNKLMEFTMKPPQIVYFYDPMQVEGDEEDTQSNLKSIKHEGDDKYDNDDENKNTQHEGKINIKSQAQLDEKPGYRLYLTQPEARTEQAKLSSAMHGKVSRNDNKSKTMSFRDSNTSAEQKVLTVKYAPCIREPGFYTPRLALDNFEGSTDPENFDHKKHKISAKGYYGKGPIIQVLDHPSLAFGKRFKVSAVLDPSAMVEHETADEVESTQKYGFVPFVSKVETPYFGSLPGSKNKKGGGTAKRSTLNSQRGTLDSQDIGKVMRRKSDKPTAILSQTMANNIDDDEKKKTGEKKVTMWSQNKALVFGSENNIALFVHIPKAIKECYRGGSFVPWEIKFVNRSAESICLFYDAENGELGSLVDEIGPFSDLTTDTWQDQKFYVTPEHADDNKLTEFTIKPPQMVYFYDPMQAEGDEEDTQSNLKSIKHEQVEGDYFYDPMQVEGDEKPTQSNLKSVKHEVYPFLSPYLSKLSLGVKVFMFKPQKRWRRRYNTDIPQWYAGVLIAYHQGQVYTIHFDDGTVERCDLVKEQFHIINDNKDKDEGKDGDEDEDSGNDETEEENEDAEDEEEEEEQEEEEDGSSGDESSSSSDSHATSVDDDEDADGQSNKFHHLGVFEGDKLVAELPVEKGLNIFRLSQLYPAFEEGKDISDTKGKFTISFKHWYEKRKIEPSDFDMDNEFVWPELVFNFVKPEEDNEKRRSLLA